MYLGPVDLLFSWYVLLLFALLGFLVGLADRGASGYFTVAMAQQPYIPPETHQLPLAASVLLGVAGSAFLANISPPFRAEYPLFAALAPCCLISTGLSILIHSKRLRTAKKTRDWEIVEFLANPDAPIPAAHGVRCPVWLHLWNGLNVALFCVLMARAVIAVVALRQVR